MTSTPKADASAISDRAIRQAYDYSQYDLAETPNIYLIFVESYGSVLYKRDDYAVAYRELLDALDALCEMPLLTTAYRCCPDAAHGARIEP